jgi:hypothetical protein
MARAQQPAAHESRRPACSPLLLVALLRALAHVLQYDRVDPTEFQLLKDEMEGLQ